MDKFTEISTETAKSWPIWEKTKSFFKFWSVLFNSIKSAGVFVAKSLACKSAIRIERSLLVLNALKMFSINDDIVNQDYEFTSESKKLKEKKEILNSKIKVYLVDVRREFKVCMRTKI